MPPKDAVSAEAAGARPDPLDGPRPPSPIRKLLEIGKEIQEQFEADRGFYLREKEGQELTADEQARVHRYRKERRRRRQRVKSGGGEFSVGCQLDFIMYVIFAVALYFALKWEYNVDLLPHFLKWVTPQWDHLDAEGNWRTRHSEEL
eukprot:Hpha_TRINITY_DN26853_c0_g1::TRINITY_DN26853_c0_g1_i1::g.17263::m.17263